MSSSVESTEGDKINTGALATIVTVGALAMIGITAALTALVRSEQDELDAERGRTANLRTVSELREKQRQNLNAPPAWVDKGEQRVSLPINRSAKLTIEELKRNPYAASPLPPEADAGLPDAGDAGMDGGADASLEETTEAGKDELTANEKALLERAADRIGPPGGDVAPENPTPRPPAPKDNVEPKVQPDSTPPTPVEENSPSETESPTPPPADDAP